MLSGLLDSFLVLVKITETPFSLDIQIKKKFITYNSGSQLLKTPPGDVFPQPLKFPVPNTLNSAEKLVRNFTPPSVVKPMENLKKNPMKNAIPSTNFSKPMFNQDQTTNIATINPLTKTKNESSSTLSMYSFQKDKNKL